MEQIDIPKASKLILLNRELDSWKNTVYQAQVRHRAFKLVESDPDVLKTFTDEIARALKMIDVYSGFIAEVEAEGAPAPNGKEPAQIDGG